MNRLLAVALCCILPCSAYTQKTEFSGDSAYVLLQKIAGEIGPRTVGSPAEQRAVAFAVGKFREYGCQEAYTMPMTVAGGVNTTSGIAVGVLRGQTRRMIVIGGHIDSSDPQIAGANDDGSGVACVLELARVIAKRQNQSTVVFCCFPGEERGLWGSSCFVEHFPEIDSVALMMQIDMADGSSDLLVLPDGDSETSAPRWLVNAAYETYYNDLGYRGLVYETHAMTLTSASREGALSDHGPFLSKGIPAIDFTSDIDYPIHTNFDDLAMFVPSGLQRSGDLVLRLFERFDGGLPSRETERYWMLQVGATLLFVDYAAIRVFLALTLLVSIVAIVLLWKRRPVIDSAQRVRWSGLKMALFALIIQSLIWISPDLVGVVKGYRFPWVNNYGAYVVLGLLYGLIGIWLSVRLAARLRISMSPIPFAIRSFVLLALFTFLLGLMALELALYPAMALFCISLSLLVRPPLLKGVFMLAAPLPMARLVFNENTIMFQRLAVSVVTGDLTSRLVSTLLFILAFVILSLPFMHGFAAVYRDARTDLFWLKRFGSGKSLAAVALAALCLMAVLLSRPVYSRWWPAHVRAEQRFAYGSQSSTVHVSSGDRLGGVRLSWNGRDTLLEGSAVEFTPPAEGSGGVPWLVITANAEVVEDSVHTDSLEVLCRHLVLRSAYRPYRVRVTYRSAGPLVATSHWEVQGAGSQPAFGADGMVLAWDSFPDTVLSIPVMLTHKTGIPVREYVEVTYDSLAFPLRMQREATCFTYRTVVSRVDTVRPG
jgi:hypothetical protein